MVSGFDTHRLRPPRTRRGVRRGGRREAGAAAVPAGLLDKLDSVGWIGDRRKHLFVVDLAGGEARQLTDGDCEDDEPIWSADGTRVLFSALRGERWDVEYVARVYEVRVDWPASPGS